MKVIPSGNLSTDVESMGATLEDSCYQFVLRCFVTVPLLLFTASPRAQAGMLVHLERTTPRAAQRGTTVEVMIQGMCLKEAREIVFYRPGIQAVEIQALPNLEHPIGLAHGARIEEQIRCKFKISPDCPLGEHPFRVRTRTEITSLGTFLVVPFPVVNENERGFNTNDSIQKAVSVPLNVSVLGKMGQGRRGDIDVYRVPVSAGQRLSVEVDSVRIADAHYAGSEYDLAVRILDESGQELASNDDNPLHLQDPIAVARIPSDGMAFVEVRRSLFTPADTDYCVHIGLNRRAMAAYPSGGQAGTKQAIKLIGDVLGDFHETIEIPTAPGSFEYFGDAPSSLLLRSSPYQNVLEEVDSSETRVPQIPAALNGIIEMTGDSDRFRVTVKKGDRFLVRVFASTLGSPIDPMLRIRRVDPSSDSLPIELEMDDTPLIDRDIFGTSFRSGGGLKEFLDPSTVWEPKAEGDYLIELSDQSGSGGPQGIYRIEIAPTQDSIYANLPSTAFDWMECVRTSGIAISQGNRWTVNVRLSQGQGSRFHGELEIIAEGLPVGVHLVPAKVPAGQSLWPVQFVAEQHASPGSALITLDARPVDRSKPMLNFSQQNVPFLNHSGGDAMRTVRMNRYVLAVTDPAPFSVHVALPSVALVRGGELSIPVTIVRRTGFNEPVEFQCDWIPPGVGRPPAAIIPAGETAALLRISAEAEAPLGRWPIVVVASTTREDLDGYLGTGRIRVCSEIVDVTIAEPFAELTSQVESVRRGERKKYTWSVNRTSPFEGKASVKLLGLPKGVSVVEPHPVLTKDSKQIVFEIEATSEALLGRVGGLNCEVTLQVGDQEIHQRTGNGTLRIDPSLK